MKVVDEAIIVPVTVNGATASLLFDTGFSGGVAISNSVEIGEADGSQTMRDFVGEFKVKTIPIKSLMVGGFRSPVKDLKAFQQPMEHLSLGYGAHCDGILGLQFIGDSVLEINFTGSKMILHPSSYDISKLPAKPNRFIAKMLPTGLKSVEMLVTTGTKKDMVMALDTGNAFFATTHNDVLERVGERKPDEKIKFMGQSGVASGAVDSYSRRMNDMTIFGVPVKTSVWDVIDAPSSSAESDGTVGFQFLKNFNITIDLGRRMVMFESLHDQVDGEPKAEIGLVAGYSPSEKAVKVAYVTPEGPAALAGIKAGHQLLSIDGKDLVREGHTKIRRMLEGKPDEPVNLIVDEGGKQVRLKILRKFLIN